MITSKIQDSHYTRSLIEASLDPLVTINTDGKITDVNEASIKVTGVSRKNLIGTDFSHYFTEPKKAQEGYLQVFEKGYVSDYPLTIKHKNGNLTDVLYNASVYKDNKGKVLGVFAAARDVTNQKQASQYARSLIEASLDPLVTINTEGQITDVNEASIKVTGVSRENLIGTDFSNYFTDPKKAQEGYQLVFEEGFVSDYSLTIKHKNGHLTDVSYNASVYKDSKGKVLGVFAAARDITEQKWVKKLRIANKELLFQLEEKEKRAAELVIANKELAFQNVEKEKRADELSIANKELVFQVKEKKKRAAELILINKELVNQYKENSIVENAKMKAESATLIAEEAVKAKQQFLSNMSHEIRTPMNAIIGFTKVLFKTELSSKQKEYLNAIKMSGDSLIVLINDILDLAKVDSGKMTFEKIPFRMEQSITSMIHLFETKVQEKDIELITEYDKKIPQVLLGDPIRFHQIILNLVSNAVKFTSKGKITVSVYTLHEDNKQITIKFAVTDTGIGIEEDKIENIFENFSQASTGTSRLYGGTGLGLAIVKQLVEPQGGSISVESKFNQGSTFSFILSFQKTNASAKLETEIVELANEIKNIKVLVVEDILLNQLLMKTLLDDFGFDRDIADNGKIAIEKLHAKTYDVILMDLQMPVMNGFEATEYIRNTLHSKIPIIALTADVTTVDLEKCKAVGINDYIAKPVDERELYRKIVGLVKKPLLDDSFKETKPVKRNSIKCTNMDYLHRLTKSNNTLIMEMISAYLKQTPPLVITMKQSLQEKDWDILSASVHKMIPSFSIMGISSDYENIAKKVQEFAKTQQHIQEIPALVYQLESVCNQACTELQQEYNNLKNSNS